MQQVRHTCGGNRPQTAPTCLQEAVQGLAVVFRFRVFCFEKAVSIGFSWTLKKGRPQGLPDRKAGNASACARALRILAGAIAPATVPG
jgi:hypothetical protein